MATLAKKLRIQLANGTQQAANIYSTPGEAGSAYMYAHVDGVQGYIPLVSTSASNKTNGRVLKGGTTYAIGASGIPPYQYRLFTSNGSFTVPAGVHSLRVSVVGGGGGGCVAGDSLDSGGFGNCQMSYPGNVTTETCYRYRNAGGGGSTTFGSISVSGGGGGVVNSTRKSSDSGESGWAASYSSAAYSGSAGSPNGGAGTTAKSQFRSGFSINGGAGYVVSLYNGSVPNNTSWGYGGGAWSSSTLYYDDSYGASGGSGGRWVGLYGVSPGQVIGYSIGGGGGQLGSGATANNGASNGIQGCVLVEWGLGIE